MFDISLKNVDGFRKFLLDIKDEFFLLNLIEKYLILCVFWVFKP